MRLLILGNGFDLHHLLPTKYINFLNVINFLIKEYDQENMKSIADVFGKEELQKIDKDIKRSYEQYFNIYNKIFIDKERVLNLIEKAKTNKWFIFLTKSFNKDAGWIDFEKEIEKVLDVYNKALINISKQFSFRKANLIEAQAECIFVNLVNFYCYGRTYFANSTEQVKQVKNEYLKEDPVGSKYYIVNKEKIIKELYDSLTDLASLLREYLNIFIEQTTKEFTNIFEANPEFCGDKVISFNYTQTYENIYGNNDTISHIHGKVDHEIVLGINPNNHDEINDMDTSFIMFKKYYQRVFYKTDTKYLLDSKILRKSRINDFSKELIIVGHSLDKTDEDIIKEWILWAKKIVIYYYSENDVGKYIKNIVSMFGKSGFDEIRKDNKVEFKQLKEIKFKN